MYDKKNLLFGISGIYRIRNLSNDKFYIGSAKCLRKRFNEHINKLKKNCHSNKYLQNAFNESKFENFTMEIIELVADTNKLIQKEQKLLDQLFDKQNNCYNLCPKAGSALGRKHSQKTKEKIKQAHLGKKLSKETKRKISLEKKKQKHLHFKSGKENPMWEIGKKHPMWGKKHSIKSIRKMCIAQKGKPKDALGKKVFQYDLNGTRINSYISCAEAQRQTGICGIRKCAIGKRKSAGGFMWSYEKMNQMKPYEIQKNINKKIPEKVKNQISETKNNKRKILLQIDPVTGKTITCYSSIAEASKITNIMGENICACCYGRRKTAGGFKWKYLL